MRFPPPIPIDTINHSLIDHFGISPHTLEFMPLGEDGWVYRVVASEGKAWFLKLQENVSRASVEVPSFLNQELGMDFVLAPERTRQGGLCVELGELKLVLFPYFNGNSLDHFSPGSDLLMQVGMCIHAIHSAVEELPPEMRKSVPQETFDHHQAMTRRVLAHADLVIGPGGAQADLRALIRCKRREMEDIFHTAQLYGERERKKGARQVLCHADIHLGNILANPQGAFRIIDWDGIMLAPPERDLMFFGALNPGNPRLEGYGRDIQIDRETIAYYKYEWVLQEFADYGEKIFFRDLGDEQKQDALEKFIELFEPGNVIDQAHEAGRLLSGL